MLIRKLVIASIFVFAGSTAALGQNAPVVWAANGNSYQLLFANLTWTQANAAAQAAVLDGRNGHLVTITSAAENAFVANLVGGDFRAWIGLSDAASEGNFRWVTGEPVVYTRWSGGEPNNSGNEDYVELFASNDSWNDRFNTPFSPSNAAYIIEWEAPPPVFSIAVIPDTQFYAEAHPHIVEAQMDWIVANQAPADENIVYVAHLGDLKDDIDCDVKIVDAGTGGGRTEWEIIDDAFQVLDDNNIAYGVVPGNHDFDSINGNNRSGCPNFSTQRPLETYNTLLGPTRFAGEAHYGDPSVPTPGNRVAGSNEDNFTLFEGSCGVKMIAINLAYKQAANAEGQDPELQWADALLKTYSDRLGIVTSHYFLEQNPNTANTTDPRNVFGSYGQEVYDELSDNPNLLMMLSAHRRGEAWRVETTGRGGMQPVHALLADYQDIGFPFCDGDSGTPPNDPNPASINFENMNNCNVDSDSGLMRIMRFDATTEMVNVQTFIPPVIPILNRPGTLASTRTVTSGDEMDTDTASNFSFSFAGYGSDSNCTAP